MNRKLKELTVYGLGMAVVFCGTYFFLFPNQLGGFMNLGDGFILLFATIASPLGGFLIGGVGSCIADVAAGYGQYMLFTLVIKGLEGAFVSYFVKKRQSRGYQMIIYALGLLIMISGYFLVDWYLQQSFAIAITGLPTNLIQALFGFIIVAILGPVVLKHTSRFLQ